MSHKHNVGIVGAGFIAAEHAQILKALPEVNLKGIYDIEEKKAASLAKKFKIPVLKSKEDILKTCEIVHVVVPPHLHKSVALPYLKAGVGVFMEKPFAVSSEECQELIDASNKSGAVLNVNHNFTFNPIYLKLKDILQQGNLGGLKHIDLIFNVPLRQLSSKQFGHWMFQSTENILFELGVHPLSQVYDLAGKAIKVSCLTSGGVTISSGNKFYKTWQISMECEKATVSLLFSVGQEFSSTMLTAICEDGQIVADYKNSLLYTQTKTQWPEFFNSFLNGVNSSFQLANKSLGNLSDFLLSTAKIKGRTDTFYTGLYNSIRSFYINGLSGQTCTSAQAGADVVEICEKVASKIKRKREIPKKISSIKKQLKESYDVLVIGGTGFIGKGVVKQLVEEGKKVLVTARNIARLPRIYEDKNVDVVSADITDSKKMDSLIKRAPIVIHLAHGGGGDTYDKVKQSMIQGTINIAESCLLHKVKHLSFISTIAALYLGDENEIIYGKTPVDRHPEQRPVYSRGKAECEKILLKMHRTKKLPVSILRPGIVIGENGIPFHSGLGIFNEDKYCIGWNEGNNPLAFVLLEDTANAICLDAFSEKTIGKTYNIVGDVRLTGREYIEELGKVLGRKLSYLPQPVLKTQAIEVGKWFIKVFIQKRKVSFPSIRDLKSRGMPATFSCEDLKGDLGWLPEKNKEEFIKKGIQVYRS